LKKIKVNKYCMKKIILCFIVFNFLFNAANAQWIKQYTDVNTAFNTVQFLDVNTGYAVGEKSISPFDAVMYKTTNGGNNWITLAFSVPGRPPINDLSFANANTGYVCGVSQYIYKTTNGGTNWSYTLASSYSNQSFEAIQFINDQTGYAGGNNGLTVKTTNGGVNWITLEISATDIHAVLFLDASTGFRSDASGYLYKTTNGGLNWTGSQLKDTNNVVYSLECIGFLDANTGYIAGAKTGPTHGVIYKTTNGGANWRSVLITNNELNGVYVTSTSDAYAVGVSRDIQKTTNGGATWFTQYLSLSTPNTSSVFFVNANTGYITEDGVIFKTTNGGFGSENHTLMGFARYGDNSQPISVGCIKAIRLNKSDGSVIVVDSTQLQADGSYILSHVTGDTVDIGIYPNSTTQNDYVITHYPSTIYWEMATLLCPSGNINNVNIGAIRLTPTTASNSVNGKVMRVTNSTVSDVKDAILYAKQGNTFVRCGTTDGNGVYHLQSLPTGTLKIIANRFGFTGDSTTVIVTPTGNIDSVNFYLRYLYVGIKKIESMIPSEYMLFQNYPNPFNPRTVIGYSLLKNGEVTLKVYDILGKEVATLVNEKQSAGVYEVQFPNVQSANVQFPSGVYFYKLQAGDITETKKMLLIK
jgi:photosystem II stability/assembly factor-like uncharacterized protein